MSDFPAKIITLRAIALKHHSFNGLEATCFAKIITLRAIALKHENRFLEIGEILSIEIITLQAKALKLRSLRI